VTLAELGTELESAQADYKTDKETWESTSESYKAMEESAHTTPDAMPDAAIGAREQAINEWNESDDGQKLQQINASMTSYYDGIGEWSHTEEGKRLDEIAGNAQAAYGDAFNQMSSVAYATAEAAYKTALAAAYDGEIPSTEIMLQDRTYSATLATLTHVMESENAMSSGATEAIIATAKLMAEIDYSNMEKAVELWISYIQNFYNEYASQSEFSVEDISKMISGSITGLLPGSDNEENYELNAGIDGVISHLTRSGNTFMIK
jgi:hypothetical protein